MGATMRYEYRNDGTLIPREDVRIAENIHVPPIRPYTQPRPNALYEKTGFYWCMTLVLAAITGSICGVVLFPLGVQTIGIEDVSETEMLIGTCLIVAGFIAGTIIYNTLCYQRRVGVFKTNNYLMSFLTSLGIGAAIVPAVILVIYIVAFILSMLAAVFIIAIVIGIISSW